MWLYCIGIIVHFLLILCASDIFFKNFMAFHTWECQERNGTARRLVFIVDDELHEYQGKFLRSLPDGKEDSEGAWGKAVSTGFDIDYTGSIGLVSGFPIDPVAGYFFRFLNQMDPIDNFLNRSNEVFYIGSKNLHDSFYRKDPGKWWASFYPEWENRLDTNASHSRLLDFALNQFKSLLRKEPFNETLKEKLHRDKTVFFIHLDSLPKYELDDHSDTVDHAVDSKTIHSFLKSIVSYIEDFYENDGKTVYLMFSGLTPKGEGGYNLTSSSVNMYPFIAWGAGIVNSSSPSWIHQIDVAALVSALLGLNFPLNSRGRIPTTLLNASEEVIKKADACNAMQMYSLALRAESILPYSSLNGDLTLEEMSLQLFNLDNSSDSSLNITADSVLDLSFEKIRNQRIFFKSIIWCCSFAISVSWTLVIFSAILPYKESLENKSVISFTELKLRITSRLNNFNSIVFSALRELYLVRRCINSNDNGGVELTANNEDPSLKGKDLTTAKIINDNQDPIFSQNLNMDMEGAMRESDQNLEQNALIRWKWLRGITDITFFVAVSLTFLALFFMSWEPIFLLYITTPVALAWLFSYSVIDWMLFAKTRINSIWKELLVHSIIFLFAAHLLIRGFQFGLELEFGLTLILLTLAYIKDSSWGVLTTWLTTGCLIILLANKGIWSSSGPSSVALILSTIALISWNVYASFRLNPCGIDFMVTVALIWLSSMCFGCIIYTDIIHPNFVTTFFAMKITCFIFAVLAFLFPAIHGQDYPSLILNICIGLSVPFILLSTGFEPLLYLLLSNFMLSWMLLEGYSDEGSETRQLNKHDARRAMLFVFFSFYINKILGSGCSFISKDIYSIRCFTDIVSDPKVTLILFMKPLLLFIMMTAIFLVICSSNGVKKNREFALVLLLFHIVGMNLFLMITLKDDALTSNSIPLVFCYFYVNLFSLILNALVLFCNCVYGIPLSREE